MLGIPPHPDVENESKCSRERFLTAGALLVHASRPFEALPRSQVEPTTAAPRRPPYQPISPPKNQQQQTVNTSVVVIRNLDMRGWRHEAEQHTFKSIGPLYPLRLWTRADTSGKRRKGENPNEVF